MPGTFRDSSSQLKNLPQAWHSSAKGMAQLCHRHGTTLSQAWHNFAIGVAQLCQRDEKSWQIAWVHIYQTTGGARRDGSPCMGTR